MGPDFGGFAGGPSSEQQFLFGVVVVVVVVPTPEKKLRGNEQLAGVFKVGLGLFFRDVKKLFSYCVSLFWKSFGASYFVAPVIRPIPLDENTNTER